MDSSISTASYLVEEDTGNAVSRLLVQQQNEDPEFVNEYHNYWMEVAAEMLYDHEKEQNSTTNAMSQSSDMKQEMLITPEINKWTELMATSSSTNLTLNETSSSTRRKKHRLRKKMSKLVTLETIYPQLLDMTDEDNVQVEEYWEMIHPKIGYLGGAKNNQQVRQALRVAYRAHRAQKRKSGEPFIIHPIQVCLLLTELQMDVETIMSGLLHDTVEDTDLTFEQVEEMFGPVVRSIVEGETKVSKLPKLVMEEEGDEQARNLRQMFIAMSDDYRIIIVKLADRLHNMRTLRFMKPEKQRRISRETLDIFAPLAHRMGIWQFKSELEDTAFMYLYPNEYKRLNKILRRHQSKFRETLDKSQKILSKRLSRDPTLMEQAEQVKVYGRTKELYSLWHKMVLKKPSERNLDQIADIVALRVIIHPKQPPLQDATTTDYGVWLCYHVLGIVQHLPGFQAVPTRVKDYISFPKPNGYQSLHTALLFEGQMVEVQIRTNAMHQVAEYGMASWGASALTKYSDDSVKNEYYNTPWLSSIKEWQEDFVCARDFVDCVRRELLGQRVFVFLRNGKILNLPKGSSVIDAAFRIHTEVGLSMYSAEINGRSVPMSYELQNGDVVNILTSNQKGHPSTDWMKHAKIRSTRSKLRSYFRAKQKELFVNTGFIMFNEFLQVHHDLLLNEARSGLLTPKNVTDINANDIIRVSNEIKVLEDCSTMDDILMEIGKKHDRQLLCKVISTILYVPLSTLEEAEAQRVFSSISTDSISSQITTKTTNSYNINQINTGNTNSKELFDFTSNPINGIFSYDSITKERNGFAVEDDKTNDEMLLNNLDVQIANTNFLCNSCLPVHGDDIVGTKLLSNNITMVHRTGCTHAQINDSTEHLKQNKKANSKLVNLKWNEVNDRTYYAEIVIRANDRNLLLADCSQAVSEICSIVQSTTLTTNLVAVIQYGIEVRNVEDMSYVIEKLQAIPSVLSVERRFGSELLSKR